MHRTHGTGRFDIPIAAIATLTAAPKQDSHGNDVTTSMTAWGADEFISYARHTWRAVIRARPETTHLLYPIIAKLIARMTDVEEHQVVEDPMMGTGGMFRAAAEVVREQGRDPHTIRWIGCDIDEIAVACATVNSMIWNLGHDIVFHVGNTFTPDWQTTALASAGRTSPASRWYRA